MTLEQGTLIAGIIISGLAILGTIGTAIHRISKATRSPNVATQIEDWRKALGVAGLEKRINITEERGRRQYMLALQHVPWDLSVTKTLKDLGHDPGSPPMLFTSDDEPDSDHSHQ